jgi:hypothetical protein
MSKIVMRVIMVGLVAMLATKAEAHSRWLYYWVIWYCAPSVCAAAHTKQEEGGKSHTEIGEVLLDKISVRRSCGKSESGIVVYEDFQVPELNLVVRKQIQDITRLTAGGVSTQIGTLVAIFPDSAAALSAYVNVNVNQTCTNGVIPGDDMLLSGFSVHGRTFAELKPGACGGGALPTAECSLVESTDTVSTVEFTCELPEFYNADNRPRIGTLFHCPEVIAGRPR